MANKNIAHRGRWREPHIQPVLYAVFLAMGAFITLLASLSSRSEEKRAVLFGYSIEKLLLGSGILLLFILLLALTVKLIRQPDWSRSIWKKLFGNETVNAAVLWGSIAIFFICWVALFVPYYRIGRLAGYISQLEFVIVWLAVVSAVTIVWVLSERSKEPLWSIILKDKPTVWMTIIIFAFFLAAGILMFSTGSGVRYPEDYWYGTGVPVMWFQIFFSLLMGVFLIWLESRWGSKFPLKIDLLLCVVLWLAAAWLWAREPIRPNYFMPDTSGNIMYPYSDSATFDGASQYALIGQGLFNSQFFDRSLYSTLLTYLHMIFGQDYEQMMTAQAVIYAVFPFIIYLLGKELHSRALGLSTAVLILLRGVNSLVSATWVDLASPKMIMTDFPTAIGIAIFTLFLIKWLKEPHKTHLAVWAGGLLGLTLMLRTHVLLLLPFAVAYIVLAGRKIRWNFRMVASAALTIGMLAATTPWDIRNYSNGLPMFYMYYARIQNVLIQRYGINSDSYVPPIQPGTMAELDDTRAGVSSVMAPHVRTKVLLDGGKCESRICVLANHMLHNLLTSVLFFPTSLEFHDLWNIVKEGPPFWWANWKGEGIGIPEGMMLALHLALISLGVGVAWERKRLLGLLPAGVYLVYILSNALALTSGGRYITPVDWIMCVYYMAGLHQVVFWFLRKAGVTTHVENNRAEIEADTPAVFSIKYSSAISAIFIVALLGSLMPLAEMPFERRYKTNTVDEVIIMLEQQGMFENTGVQRATVDTFLTDPLAQVTIGRLLYPRYYESGDGEADRHYPYVHLDYPRNVFIVIGPLDVVGQNVIIAGDRSEFLTHAADVVVIGCKNELNIDGLAVFILSESGNHVYFRTPQPEWKCPLPVP